MDIRMDNSQTDQEPWLYDPLRIEEDGERVSHLHPSHFFYAHLSIYDFAVPFCEGAVVLDAGSGAGYGAAHLADAGAEYVLGIDISDRAVEFSKHHFQRDNLDFRLMSVERVADLLPQRFDVIFSSNTLEHVPSVMGFLRGAWSLLKPGGVLLVAVPPITDDRLLYLNLINAHHVNLWSPRQWSFVLSQFFQEVSPYLHGVEGIGEDFQPEHAGTRSGLTEKDFVIEPGTVEDMYDRFTLTAIFVARGPRLQSTVSSAAPLPQFVDDSFTREPGYIDPNLRKRLRGCFEPQEAQRSLFARALHILRKRGVLALGREMAAFAKRRLDL
jgi:2-polyprenyl-3-methyl-5-hydroxy-6-metoxy-1,4-benzoquinol methylase